MQIAPFPPGKQNAGQTVPWTGGNCIAAADVSGDKTSSGQSDTRHSPPEFMYIFCSYYEMDLT